ncbi:MAG: sigma-70 family RNA polymerase sigma factor, partial [Bacteroidetes bacterium]
SEEAARDVFQDAIISLLMAVEEGRFKGESSLSTYLFAIGKNLWFRRFNRSLRQESLDARPVDVPEEDAGPELRFMAQEATDLLGVLLGSLKAKCREVLGMWARKYAMKEIAAELGYANEQVARNKKTQCLKELKERVRQHPDARQLALELLQARTE